MLFETHDWPYLPLMDTMHMNCVGMHVPLIFVTTELMTERPDILMKGVNTDGLTFLLSFTNDDSNNDNYH